MFYSEESDTVIIIIIINFIHFEVGQSGLSQGHVLHQEAAVLHRYVWGVQDVSLPGENDRQVLDVRAAHTVLLK